MNASGWPMAGGGTDRAGCHRGAVHLGDRPWRVLPAGGSVQASAVFDREGRCLIADMTGTVQAFDRGGTRLWRQAVEGGISASPAVDTEAGFVFAATHLGWVYALACATGEVRWRQQIPTRSDARILSDLLWLPERRWMVLSSWGGRFCALDAETGAIRDQWEAGISPASAACATATGELLALRARPDIGVELVQLDPAGTERVLHHQPEGKNGARRTRVTAGAVVDPERRRLLFITNTDPTAACHAWSLEASQRVWSHPLPRPVAGTPAVTPDGTLVIADLAGSVHAVGSDGAERHRYATGCEYLLAGPVCDAAGRVFQADPLGQLHVIEPSGQGRVVFDAKRSFQARPSFDHDGNLYLPGTDGRVHVFRNEAAPAA